jgi:hypothetical protein
MICTNCKEKEVLAKGLCNKCYSKQYRKLKPLNIKKYNKRWDKKHNRAKYQQNYWKLHPDKYETHKANVRAKKQQLKEVNNG